MEQISDHVHLVVSGGTGRHSMQEAMARIGAGEDLDGFTVRLERCGGCGLAP